jgi:GPI mannosyltransferase 3
VEGFRAAPALKESIKTLFFKMNRLIASPYRNLFFISLVVYLTTAFFSVGYYHADEHFQILEFCNYKLGKSPASDLPWEFNERIRPTLQPALALGFIKIASAIGISSPYTWALLMRLITAVLSWFLTCHLCLLLMKNFSSEVGKKAFLLLTLFSWFVPFICVRFSSENYSALTFLSVVYLLINFNEGERTNFRDLLLAGLLLGFSFFFRFQIAFAILGLGAWLLFIKRMKIKYLLLIIFAATCAISICIYIDYWFYGKFELTPVNYFISNIVDNKAAQWGVYPWWWYFNLVFQQAVPPFSIFLLIFFFVGLYKKPKDIFTWCMVPFLIAHFLVGHKEMRFLFPMLLGFMYLTAVGIENIYASNKYPKLLRIAFRFSLVINVPLIIVRMFIPAQEGIAYFKFIQDYSVENNLTLFSIERNVYELSGLPVNFYKPASSSLKVFKDRDEWGAYVKEKQPPSAIILERTLTVENKFVGYNTNSIYCVFPLWIRYFNFGDWQSRAEIWNIQRIDKIK